MPRTTTKATNTLTMVEAVQETTTREVEQEALAAREDAHILHVEDADSYESAAAVVKRLKGVEKRVNDWFGPLVDAAYKPWKMLTARRKAALDALAPELTRLQGEMVAWDFEQERLRKYEQERLAEIERQAQQDEALRQAAELERQGHKDQAAAVIEAAIVAPAPAIVLASTTPEVAGISVVDNWQFDVLNVALIPREYLEPDMMKIGRVVKAMKSLCRIPGVRVYNKGGMRVRT